MQEHSQSPGHQLLEVEASSVAAKAAWTDAKLNVQSLTASESILRGEVSELAWRVGELGDSVAKIRQ